MLYTIRARDRRESQIETSDCVIIAATPAYRWAIGKKLAEFQQDIKGYGAAVRIPLDQTKRSPSLGTGKHYRRDRVPTDSEILARYLPES